MKLKEENEEVEVEVEVENKPDTLEDAIMDLYGENEGLDPTLDGIFVEIQKMKQFIEYRLLKIKVLFYHRGVSDVPGLDDLLNTIQTTDILSLGKQYFQLKRFVRIILENESG